MYFSTEATHTPLGWGEQRMSSAHLPHAYTHAAAAATTAAATAAAITAATAAAAAQGTTKLVK